jgi:hypothetical protein
MGAGLILKLMTSNDVCRSSERYTAVRIQLALDATITMEAEYPGLLAVP